MIKQHDRTGATQVALSGPTARRVALVALVALASLVPASMAAAAPGWGITMTHKNPPGQAGTVDPIMGDATTLARGSGGNTYTITVTNTGTTATSGPVTVAAQLPPGLRLSTAAPIPFSGSGWGDFTPGGDPLECQITNAATAFTCTRSDVLAAGGSYPPLLVKVTAKQDAADAVDVSAIVAGGGAFAPVSVTDPTRIVTVPFGIHSFTTKVADAAGNDYTQAGGHPFSASTTVIYNSISDEGGGLRNVGNNKELVADLPPGFVGNPQVVDRCTMAQLQSNTCPATSKVGIVKITNGLPSSGVPSYNFLNTLPIYNVEPPPGQPAFFGFVYFGTVVPLEVSLRSDGDYGITVGDKGIGSNINPVAVELTFCGNGVGGTPFAPACSTTLAPGHTAPFLTNPTDCSVTPVTTMRTNTYADPEDWVSATAPSPRATGCDQLPFAPSFTAVPSIGVPDAPTGLDVGLAFPQAGLVSEDGLATAHLKRAVVTLPPGMSINPTAADGLTACPDSALGLHSLAPMSCPDASKIGTATATSPLLQETLTGGVYLRPQNSMDPESGEMFRIALVLESKQRGVSVRLPGQVRADAKTGQLTATFDNNPQLPVDDIKLQFKGGSRAPLATPKVCGKHTIGAQLSSWAGQQRDLSSAFTLGCPAGLGWFGPYFSAGTVSPVAGASTSFVLRTDKPDGQSDMNAIALSLPEGLIASLKGNVGRQIGTATVGAGPGPTPFWLSGPVVLEGPYGDAPFSLRVTVPVVAGPFNLGDVVVRQKIYVDPHDAHVTVVSDPLPTIVKGVPVRLQNLRVNIDKAGFMRNPTSCAVKSIGGTLGADTGQTAPVASRFQVGGCANLPLRPKMAMELTGSDQIKRGKHPTLSTTLTQQPGESNLKSVKVRLPLSLALDPDNAQALCTPGQAVAKACPAGSIVGKATAISPVLNRPLTGDVFFVEGTRLSKEGRTVKTLPRLWVALWGEVAIDVWADSSISDGKYLVTTFPFVPDAPISSFKLDINGGDHGILAVTGDSDANLCQRRLITDAEYVGQNGKQVKDRVHMDSPCGFKVRAKSVSVSHAKVTVSGIGAGKLTISGKGIHKASRTIKHSKVATIKPRLTASGKRLYKGRKAIRLRVSFDPAVVGQQAMSTTTVVKRAKKASSSTRGHRSSRTR